MEKQSLSIKGIPAILWGPPTEKMFIAVHGDLSNKDDVVIGIFAGEAAKKGYRVLSFDLPENGERKNEERLCNPQNCTEDLMQVIAYAHTLSNSIRLFGCSIGAYFGMLAYRGEAIGQALFLSPVVDMRRIIENMMGWFDISKERLEKEQIIPTPAKALYWDYYQYTLEHPITWDKPTALLYGAKDELCKYAYVKAFAKQSGADMTVVQDGEHFFHTKEQLAFLRKWLAEAIV